MQFVWMSAMIEHCTVYSEHPYWLLAFSFEYTTKSFSIYSVFDSIVREIIEISENYLFVRLFELQIDYNE